MSSSSFQLYEPPPEADPDSILVTCCTNGLGHVHQMERVLGELEAAGLRFPVIVLAKEQKVPAYKLASLKKRFPDAKFVNLNWEVDYDDGKSFQNSKIVWSATKSFTAMAPQMARKVSALLRTHRPAYCLSFWEPGVAMFIDILNAPTKLMKEIGYGVGYTYDHNAEEGFSGDDYWPEEMDAQTYYEPVDRGFEREVKKRLDYWDKLRRDRKAV